MLIKRDIIGAVVLRHPARICHDAAHALAAERGLSSALVDEVARRTWKKWRSYPIVNTGWPLVVAAELAHSSEQTSGRK
jgi:hypothetical protein